MQAWLETDGRGRQVLVRSGTGVVTAVVPLGTADADGRHGLFRVEIYCDAPHGRPGAIRFTAHPAVSSADPLLDVARRALDEVWAVEWTVQWHRNEGIPDDLPVTALNLATDTRAVLAALDPVVVPEPMDAALPEFLPGAWIEERP